VPADQSQIQLAINAASDGDTIVVAPGIYRERINFGGKAITVVSDLGAEATTIDGGRQGPVVSFVGNEGPTSILKGFTIQNGYNPYGGAGVIVQNASPSILDNTIIANAGCGGAGIDIETGSPTVQANRIAGNEQGSPGGCPGSGIRISGYSSSQIIDNLVANNVTGAGISMNGAGSPTIARNSIVGNGGGGIEMVNASDPLIVQNVIAGNRATRGGGIFWLVPSIGRGPYVVSNTIASNHAQQGSGVFADGYDANSLLVNNIIVSPPGETALHCGDFNNFEPPIIRFNNIYSIGGEAYGGICGPQTGINGNISSNPQFANPWIGDCHLKSESASIDVGDNSAPGLQTVDLDGDERIIDGDGNGTTVVDLGVDEFAGSTTLTQGLCPAVREFWDPYSDTFGVSSFKRDIARVEAAFGSSLIIEIQFFHEVSPPSLNIYNSVYGAVYLDIDQNPITGFPRGDLGLEYLVDLGSEQNGMVDVVRIDPAGNPVSTSKATIDFASMTLTLDLPANVIGGDDGLVNYQVAVGGADDTTDVAPNLEPATSYVRDTDYNGVIDKIDTDDDNDALSDGVEIGCGSDPLSPASLPERIDTPGDDDGDTLVNEALPPGAEAYDCDGDGYAGTREANVTTSDQDPCGGSGWPSDLFPGTPGGFQYNTLNIQDLGTFIAPVRRFGTSPGHPNFSVRWDLVPGGTIGGAINIQDIAATITGASGFPPMLGTQKAFGKTCPYAP
jgi:parallel beta-helix repeat protein